MQRKLILNKNNFIDEIFNNKSLKTDYFLRMIRKPRNTSKTVVRILN